MKYPIGIQTFEDLIEGGYIYVDKTDLIYQLVDTGKYYFLSRPRRFGKSLLTSTLEAFFLGKKELFKGLAIEKKETKWERHPVFHLDFSGETYNKAENINHKLEIYFSQWERQYGKNPIEEGFGNRLAGLIQRAYEKTGKKAVILIDEYDKPLTDTIGMGDLQEQNRAILQGLYGVFKNADKNIHFSFLTGVTRYGKLGIFSSANNLNDISMSNLFAEICGITERELHTYFDKEIQLLAESNGMGKDEMYSKLKQKYNGYHFSANAEGVYNPFSLLNALYAKQTRNYWFATGTPTYLAKILKGKNYNLTKLTKTVLATEESMASFGNGENNITAALYQSGYLTIKQADNDGTYMLGLPNEEVTDGFIKYLAVEFTGKDVDEWARVG